MSASPRNAHTTPRRGQAPGGHSGLDRGGEASSSTFLEATWNVLLNCSKALQSFFSGKNLILIYCTVFSLGVFLAGFGIVVNRPAIVRYSHLSPLVDLNEINSFQGLMGFREIINMVQNGTARYFPSLPPRRDSSSSALSAAAEREVLPTTAEVVRSPFIQATIDSIVSAIQTSGPGNSWTLASRLDGWAIDPKIELALRKDFRLAETSWQETNATFSPPIKFPFSNRLPSWTFYDTFLDSEREADRASTIFGTVNAMMCLSNLTLSTYFWARKAALGITPSIFAQMNELDRLCISDNIYCPSPWHQDLANCLRVSRGDPYLAMEYMKQISPSLIVNEHATGRWAGEAFTIFQGSAGATHRSLGDHELLIDYLSLPGSLFSYYTRSWKSSMAAVATLWAGLFLKAPDNGIKALWSEQALTLLRFSGQLFNVSDVGNVRDECMNVRSPDNPYFLNTTSMLKFYEKEMPSARDAACQGLGVVDPQGMPVLDSLIYCDSMCSTKGLCDNIPTTTGLILFLQEDDCSMKTFKLGINFTKLFFEDCGFSRDGASASASASTTRTTTGAPVARYNTWEFSRTVRQPRTMFFTNVAMKLRYNITAHFDEIIWLSLQVQSHVLVQEPMLSRTAKNLEKGGIQSRVTLHQISGEANTQLVVLLATLAFLEVQALMRIFRTCNTKFVTQITKKLSFSRLFMCCGMGSGASLMGRDGKFSVLTRMRCLLLLYMECLTVRVRPDEDNPGRFKELDVFTSIKLHSIAFSTNYGAILIHSVFLTCLHSFQCEGSVPRTMMVQLLANIVQVCVVAYTGLLYVMILKLARVEVNPFGDVTLGCSTSFVIAACILFIGYLTPFFSYRLKSLPSSNVFGFVPDAMRLKILGKIEVGQEDFYQDKESGSIWTHWTILTAQVDHHTLNLITLTQTHVNSYRQMQVSASANGGGVMRWERFRFRPMDDEDKNEPFYLQSGGGGGAISLTGGGGSDVEITEGRSSATDLSTTSRYNSKMLMSQSQKLLGDKSAKQTSATKDQTGVHRRQIAAKIQMEVEEVHGPPEGESNRGEGETASLGLTVSGRFARSPSLGLPTTSSLHSGPASSILQGTTATHLSPASPQHSIGGNKKKGQTAEQPREYSGREQCSHDSSSFDLHSTDETRLAPPNSLSPQSTAKSSTFTRQQEDWQHQHLSAGEHSSPSLQRGDTSRSSLQDALASLHAVAYRVRRLTHAPPLQRTDWPDPYNRGFV